MPAVRLGLILVLSNPAFIHAEATVSLKAVAKNGVAIPGGPTSALDVARGDLVTAEIYLSGWSTPPFDGTTGLLNAYQVTLAGKAGAQSSGNCSGQCNSGYIVPLGWDAPLERDPCPCDDPCYPICIGDFYGCVGPDFNPDQMASTHSYRSDFIFSGLPCLHCEPRTGSPDVGWSNSMNYPGYGQTASRCQGGSYTGFSCTVNADCPGGTCNANFQSYVGTLNLKIGSTACGTYTFNLSNSATDTFICNTEVFPICVAVPVIQGLTLTVSGSICHDQRGACCNEELLSCTDGVCPEDCTEADYWFGGAGSICAAIHCVPPPNIPITPSTHCIVDARIPFLPNQPTQRRGFTQWTLTFFYPPGSGENDPTDFAITQIPDTTPPHPPGISSIVIGAGNTATIDLSAPIQPNKWTCLTHITSGSQMCHGFLPGDASGNLYVTASDILPIIDNLNGLLIPALPNSQCDIDRSGVCAPVDILYEIDLLNGANGFPNQNGDTLPPCPSQTP